jgi:hypothetical protein
MASRLDSKGKFHAGGQAAQIACGFRTELRGGTH